jgi:hypothetical protein
MRELFFAYLATRPEFAKAKSCRKSLVGPMRTFLWRHGAAQTDMWPDFWSGAPPHALALIAERAEASDMLADFCARCGRCAWSKANGIMMSPPEPGPQSPDTDPDAGHGR